jgi:hypothetical protein
MVWGSDKPPEKVKGASTGTHSHSFSTKRYLLHGIMRLEVFFWTSKEFYWCSGLPRCKQMKFK